MLTDTGRSPHTLGLRERHKNSEQAPKLPDAKVQLKQRMTRHLEIRMKKTQVYLDLYEHVLRDTADIQTRSYLGGGQHHDIDSA
jgi:hypothetical protein